MKYFILTLTLVMSSAVIAKPTTIRIDGSSTVGPLNDAVVETYSQTNKDARLGTATSGTGGGFQKLCKGEIDLAGASRAIHKDELEDCSKNGVAVIELPIAYDGLAVVVNKENTWAKDLTTEELKLIWAPESAGKVILWSHVRKSFPSIPLKLFGPGTDSGTFDYFTKAIVGKEKSSRADYSSSENDNIIATGISKEKGALGYFGLAYATANQKTLSVVAIKNKDSVSAVTPTEITVKNGSYKPLSRPLFLYASVKSLTEKPQLEVFTKFYLDHIGKLAHEVGYVGLESSIYSAAKTRLEKKILGSIMEDPKNKSLALNKIFK